ncbi:hypothetical protein HMPREF1583_00496 [Gardnerella vaginalis JCP8151B]|nr:hypothetical protein HMPREF1583_00496 [Gardnerella vaginalis JCP8151B]
MLLAIKFRFAHYLIIQNYAFIQNYKFIRVLQYTLFLFFMICNNFILNFFV